jgi:hypothetical protein
MQPKYGSLIEPSLDLSQVPRRRAIRSTTLVFVFDFSRLHDGHLPIAILCKPSSVGTMVPKTSLA